MLNFQKDYPTGRMVLLDTNYRCSGHILNKALKVIEHNKKRYPKNLKTPNESGADIRVHCLSNGREENLFVIQELLEYQKQGGILEDTAILLRTKIEAEGLIGLCMEYQLPFYMKERLPNIFEHWISRDILAYIRLARGENSRSNFLQVMNRPNRYISREAVSEKVVNFDNLRNYYKRKDWMCDRLDHMEHMLKALKKLNPFAAINFIRKGIGYEEYLQEYALYRKVKPEELFDILDRLQESAKGVQSYEEWQEKIQEYGQKLKEQARKQEYAPQGVTISTLHSSKGLEYDRVYILNVNEGTIPYRKAVLDVHMEEERRLFYVGMTRARRELILCYVLKQFEKEKEKSRFLIEMQGDVIDS